MAIISLRLLEGAFEPPAFNLFCRFCFLDWWRDELKKGINLPVRPRTLVTLTSLTGTFEESIFGGFLREIVLFWWNWWDRCGGACDENENLFADRLFFLQIACEESA